MNIHQARDWVLTQVHDPALDSMTLDKSIKDSLQSSKNMIQQMKKVGDLYLYLKRFEDRPAPGKKEEVYEEMSRLGFKTYKDILPKFREIFSNHLDDVTTLNDFVIGGTYSSWDIAIFSKTYNIQSGIYLIPGQSNTKAIFIKATLEDGKYPNEWIVPNKILKYYFYSLKGNFSPDYKVNRAILEAKEENVPIYVFIKEGTRLTLSGLFECMDSNCEKDGSRWFELKKVDSYDTNIPMSAQEYHRGLAEKIEISNDLGVVERRKRLKNAPRKPELVQIITNAYKRNPDVIAEVLHRADGKCENCKKDAPFVRKNDGTPYLEVHHIVPLSEDGDDTVENAIALCPNCHRQAHFGEIKKQRFIQKDNIKVFNYALKETSLFAIGDDLPTRVFRDMLANNFFGSPENNFIDMALKADQGFDFHIESQKGIYYFILKQFNENSKKGFKFSLAERGLMLKENVNTILMVVRENKNDNTREVAVSIIEKPLDFLGEDNIIYDDFNSLKTTIGKLYDALDEYGWNAQYPTDYKIGNFQIPDFYSFTTHPTDLDNNNGTKRK